MNSLFIGAGARIQGVQWGEFVGELFIEIGQTRQRINASKTLKLDWSSIRILGLARPKVEQKKNCSRHRCDRSPNCPAVLTTF
jgi:hypothetical protein